MGWEGMSPGTEDKDTPPSRDADDDSRSWCDSNDRALPGVQLGKEWRQGIIDLGRASDIRWT